jgi:hypothetical protein
MEELAISLEKQQLKAETSPAASPAVVQDEAIPEAASPAAAVSAPDLSEETDEASETEEASRAAATPEPLDHEAAVAMDHCYSLPPDESAKRQQGLNHDHGYVTETKPKKRPLFVEEAPKKPQRPPRAASPPLPALAATFGARPQATEYGVLYEFLTQGVDDEDVALLKKSYEMLLTAEKYEWLNDTHWVDHPDILFTALYFGVLDLSLNSELLCLYAIDLIIFVVKC